MGLHFFPLVGWAERRFSADGPGNSVPRFHITWGTGPAVINPFTARVRTAVAEGRARLAFRHRVDYLSLAGGSIRGVGGSVLESSPLGRGRASSRTVVGEFEFPANAVVVASGGIGGSLERVRRLWPESQGTSQPDLLTGVPTHVDGRMLDISRGAGADLINEDRMWHYTEGIKNWDPIWPNHGIRILPGPSSLWLDAMGRRLPSPLFPGFDTLGTLRHIMSTGQSHSWFILNQAIIKREFALSGSEQNPDLTGKSIRLLAGRLLARRSAPAPVEAFKQNGEDFVVAGTLAVLIARMRQLSGMALIRPGSVEAAVESRDAAVGSTSDDQLRATENARHFWTERAFRIAKPARILDPNGGPLIAVRLRVLTRKTLGGLHTDLDGRVLDRSGAAIPGLFAAGEAAGFGGGGVHGYRALEGTFLGGCLFSGRVAGRAAARS